VRLPILTDQLASSLSATGKEYTFGTLKFLASVYVSENVATEPGLCMADHKTPAGNAKLQSAMVTAMQKRHQPPAI
jgi:hypothetical protein